MAEIPLARRSQLPPSRVGAVKPPLLLADRSGERQLGATITQFSGVIHDQLVQTRAANEQAVFQGEVKTAMQEWDTFVAGNPAASYEELNKERERMMGGIRDAGQLATTSIAKRANTNWYAANQNLIREQTETSMQAIRSRQELAASQRLERAFVENLDSIGLHNHYFGEGGMVAAGLYSKEFADAKFLHEGAIITNAKDKIDAKADKDTALGIAVAQRDKDDVIDLKKAQEEVNKLDIPNEDKLAVMKDARDWKNQEKVINDETFTDAVAQAEEAWDKLIQEDKFVTAQESVDAFDTGLEGQYLRDEIALKQKWRTAISAEVKAQAEEKEIVSVSLVYSNLMNDVPGIITGTADPENIMQRATTARYIDRTLSEDDFRKVQTAVQAKYISAQQDELAAAKANMRGVLLNPNALGSISQPSIRNKIYGDAVSELMAEIAKKGDELGPGDIYVLARKITATHQKSDRALSDEEEAIERSLEAREEQAKVTEAESKMVRVQHPDGRTGRVTPENLEAALAAGFVRLDGK